MATFKHRTREEWQEIATSPDPMKRGELNSIIRSTGQEPTTYMTWSLPQRIDFVMRLQEQDGKPPVAETPAPAAAAEEPVKTKGKAKATPEAAPAGTGVSAEEFKKLQAQYERVEKALAAQYRYLCDIQLMVRVLLLSNPEAKANFEDEGCQALYEKLAYTSGN